MPNVYGIVVNPAGKSGGGKPLGDRFDANDLFAIPEDHAHTRERFGSFRVKATEEGTLAVLGKSAESVGPFRFGQ